MGAVLSFGQDARWRRTMVSKVNALPGSRVLDVATGTGLVARELAARKRRPRGPAGPQRDDAPRRASRRREAAGLEPQVRQTLGRAERLPFADETFDAVTFTYLLRYVDDPEATMRELARVLRPGGTLACLEFFTSRRPALARGVVGLHAGRHAGRRRRRLAGVAPHRPVPRPEHRARSTSAPRSPEQVRWWQAAGCATCGRASCRSAPASSSGR